MANVVEVDQLVVAPGGAIDFATNRFINTPIILQHDDTPLIEMVEAEVAAGWTTQFQIFHPDGTYLARAKGSQIYRTPEGEKAGVHLRHPQGATICEMNGKTVFEIHRTEAAALKTDAELYTPNGRWVRCTRGINYADVAGKPLNLSGVVLQGNTIEGFRIGIWIKSNGSLSIAVK